MKTIVILQSCYIPWKGFFDLIRNCDEFVLFDDTQFTRRDWRSRNRIKTANGSHWLTIPVESKGRFEQLINQARVVDPTWAERHWQSIHHAYARAPHYIEQESWIKKLYEAAANEPMLSRINALFIVAICDFLKISTKISWSDQYPGDERKEDRLIEICRQARATSYLSGPAARAYIDPAKFMAANIALKYFNYDGYVTYPQAHGPFEHQVSIVDAIFNLGPEAIHVFDRIQNPLLMPIGQRQEAT